MANRKFHYGGKKKTYVSDGAPAERNAAQDNSRGRNDRQRRHTGSAQAVSRYPAEKTAVSVKELGAAENTVALLSKYRIGTVADLVSRTEKDMFKVQGFNKKMLLELKGLLAGKGMTNSLRVTRLRRATTGMRVAATRKVRSRLPRRKNALRRLPNRCPSKSGERFRKAESGVFTTE